MLAARGSPLLESGERIARSHHERWDGASYPYGLAGPDIPLLGRIVALAHVFDAPDPRPPCKSAWSLEGALAETNTQRGHQFDPELVDAFLALFPAPRNPRTSAFTLSPHLSSGLPHAVPGRRRCRWRG
jgi:cyclic di-GMP phosphodiesterase